MLHPEMGSPHLLTGVALVFLFFIPVLLLGLSLMTFYHVAVYVKPASPTRGMIVEFKKFFSNPSRLVPIGKGDIPRSGLQSEDVALHIRKYESHHRNDK